ncbi:e2F transcription factor CC-MB domain-containing protein [Phthorimaea operculella]|nr:e2F transcription factor CC-MB domain-containing protein [Phthorimaea operculella]
MAAIFFLLSAEHGGLAYITYGDLRSIKDFRNQTVIPIKAPPDTRLSVPHPDEKGYMIHLKSMSGEIEVYLCPKERPVTPTPSSVLPPDPLLEDNKALLAPLIAQLQAVSSATVNADFSTPVKREPVEARVLEICAPCVTDPTMPLDNFTLSNLHTPQHEHSEQHEPHSSASPAASGSTPKLTPDTMADSGARGRLRHALIADSDDFAPIMGGGRFQLQTEDQESESLELEPFLALEPPMSATDYGFCLDHDEGLAELFDFEF